VYSDCCEFGWGGGCQVPVVYSYDDLVRVRVVKTPLSFYNSYRKSICYKLLMHARDGR